MPLPGHPPPGRSPNGDMRWAGRPEQKHQRTTFQRNRVQAPVGAWPHGKTSHPLCPGYGSDGSYPGDQRSDKGVSEARRLFEQPLP